MSLKCQFKTILYNVVLTPILVINTLNAATLNLANEPLFLTDKVAPLTLLVMNRDHNIFFEAYNDATDLDGDGIYDLTFKPSIKYLGYFDSNKCYSYNSSELYFYPISQASFGKCNGSWSGNFLNYTTTTRLDAIRKILYGGYRAFDTTDFTLLQRTNIAQDGHSWGKEYSSIAINGYDISQYTPFKQPSTGRHLFANTTLRNAAQRPLLRVALNQPYRIWEWVSIERPVAGNKALHGENGVNINGITDYVVRVKVCDPNVGLEENCRTYPNGNAKPIGLLQEFGENDSMKFGLLTGSYANNLAGGIIRKNISSIKDEINLNTGQFNYTTGATSTVGIISSLDSFKMINFRSDYSYDCGWITTRNIYNGECNMWGNPIAEMMYESIRYFSGKMSPTSLYNNNATLDLYLGLPKPAWEDPYANNPRCAKANLLVISDLYPTYDSDQIPGSSFGGISSDLTPNFDASALTNQISSTEGLNGIYAYIGQSGRNNDGAPTPKQISSLSNIRGLAPHSANYEGSYYSAGAAYYGWMNDLNPAEGVQNLESFIVALAPPSPEFNFNVGGQVVSIIPFGKSVSGLGISHLPSRYQPNNNIVDFYIESLNGREGVFRVNFEDVQQGADFDMDAVVTYKVTVNSNNTITVDLESSYSAGTITQHMGYIISGTTQDGVYLEVRDPDTAYYSDVDYYLDTPPSGYYLDYQALPTKTSRTFTPSKQSATKLLKSPLWYAAKWGGFNDLNQSNTPDDIKEYSNKSNGDPNNYFLVINATYLKEQLAKVFETILDKTGSFASSALSSGFLAEETRIYQAIFKTKDWSGQLLAFKIDETTGEVLTNGSGPQGSMWDASERLNLLNYNTGRQIITYKPSTGIGIPFRWPSNLLNPSQFELDTVQAQQLNIDPVAGVADNLGERRLNYIRGQKTFEGQGTFRERSTLLGDIINSNPIEVSIPEQNYPFVWSGNAAENDHSYAEFRQSMLDRQSMIYVGANDGMLHAFNADTGYEVFSYVPSTLYHTLANFTSTEYNHLYYADGSPTVVDAFLNGQWRTILVAGMNGGGQGIYVLDITNPGNFSESNARNMVLWEFTDANDIDLGYTYSQPAIVRLANGKWAAIFGNGFNNTHLDNHISTTGNAILYIVDLETGQLIKKFDTKVGMSADPLNLGRPNGLATPAVVDMDGNSIADRVYAGDLFGNVWKIDISSSNANQWNFSYKSGNTPIPFFKAINDNGQAQPITIKPTIARLPFNPFGVMVMIGTGKFIEVGDKTNQDVQSIYGLIDDNTTRIQSRNDLMEQTILQEEAYYRVTSSNQMALNDRGWFLDLRLVDEPPKGERIISNMLYQNKKIIFTTIIPTADPCDFGGDSWLMELDAFTGNRLTYNVFDINGDRLFNNNDSVTVTINGETVEVPVSGIKSQAGLIATPSILNAGNVEYKYLSGTSGSIQKINENPGASQVGRQSWRQLR